MIQMSWQGHIAVPDCMMLLQFPAFAQTQTETTEQFERSAYALRAALQANSEKVATLEKGFYLHICWHNR